MGLDPIFFRVTTYNKNNLKSSDAIFLFVSCTDWNRDKELPGFLAYCIWRIWLFFQTQPFNSSWKIPRRCWSVESSWKGNWYLCGSGLLLFFKKWFLMSNLQVWALWNNFCVSVFLKAKLSIAQSLFERWPPSENQAMVSKDKILSIHCAPKSLLPLLIEIWFLGKVSAPRALLTPVWLHKDLFMWIQAS